LFVDDEEPVRMVLGRWVQTLGHGLLVAESAEAAVEILENPTLTLPSSTSRCLEEPTAFGSPTTSERGIRISR